MSSYKFISTYKFPCTSYHPPFFSASGLAVCRPSASCGWQKFLDGWGALPSAPPICLGLRPRRAPPERFAIPA